MGDLMVYVFGAIVDLMVPSGPSAERRANQAYRTAWKTQVREDDVSIEILREAFKQHSATGAYVDPDGTALTPWLAAWRAGLPPGRAGRQVKKVRKAESNR